MYRLHVNSDTTFMCCRVQCVGSVSFGEFPPAIIQDGMPLKVRKRIPEMDGYHEELLQVYIDLAGREYQANLLPCDLHTHNKGDGTRIAVQ